MVSVTITVVKDAEGLGDDPVHEVARGLRRLIASGESFHSARARELQLGPSDLVALNHLFGGGSMAPKDLSALMGVTSGTMTALLDRVEKAGFLKREPHPDDRRALLIHLTPAGEHAMQWLSEQFDAAVRHSLANVPELGFTVLEKALNELSRSLESETGETPRTGRIQQLTPVQPPQLHGV